MRFWTLSLMFIFHEKCQSFGHVKMQTMPCNTPLFWCFGLTLNHPKLKTDVWKKNICLFMGNEKCLWTPTSAVVFACACHFEGLRSGLELVIHLAQCGLDNQSAGVVRRIFFLLRHLSKFPRLKMKIYCVVSEIWPWEFSLRMLHLKREVCLRIPEYADVWSGVVLLRRKPENPKSSKQVSRVPLYASAPIAFDGPVYARLDVVS